MELRHLRNFVVLAEELHFARAASRLGIEQSPLSRAIRDLEIDIRVRLFARTRRSTNLTPAGEAFLSTARRILADADAAVREMRAHGAGPTIRLGVAEGTGGSGLTRFIDAMANIESGFKLSILERPLRDLIALAAGEALDGLLTAERPVTSLLVSISAWEDSFELISPLHVGHRKLADLRGSALILPDPQAMPGLSLQVREILRVGNIQHDVVGLFSTAPTLARMVEASIGAGLLPDGLAPSEPRVAVHRLPLRQARYSVWLATRNGDRANPRRQTLVRAAETVQRDGGK
ncbi:LysR family transcriptional regulator [Phenylobacterium sp.]|uniref:LysR family transcriptional regulator n=1 Tax=Phenylobacterium sp. TaxID=1871053 RepID=UPI003FA7D93F